MDKEMKMLLMIGADKALDYKEKNWRATKEEILQYIIKHSDEFLKQMDNPL